MVEFIVVWLVAIGVIWASFCVRSARRNAAQRKAEIAARADYELWMLNNGYEGGVYGRFPPAPLPSIECGWSATHQPPVMARFRARFRK